MEIEPQNFPHNFPRVNWIVLTTTLAGSRIRPKVDQNENRIKHAKQQREFTVFVRMNLRAAESCCSSQDPQFLRADEKNMTEVASVFSFVQKADGAGFVDGQSADEITLEK